MSAADGLGGVGEQPAHAGRGVRTREHEQLVGREAAEERLRAVEPDAGCASRLGCATARDLHDERIDGLAPHSELPPGAHIGQPDRRTRPHRLIVGRRVRVRHLPAVDLTEARAERQVSPAHRGGPNRRKGLHERSRRPSGS